MFIRSLLAIPQAITDNFKWIAIGAAALLGVIALICGLCKGFYRTSRRWIKFISVVSLFFFLCARFIDQNPIEKIAFVKNLADDLRLAVIVGSYLLASIVAVNIVFGIIDAIVKAAAIKKLEKSVAVSTKKDPREREREQRAIDKKWKPNAFSRLCGGVACVLNVGICAGFIAALIVYGCSYSSRLTGDIFAFVYNDLPEKVLDYLRAYALDSVALLFILSVSYCGYRAGALNGLRAVFMTFGIFVNRIEKIGSVHFFRPIVTDPVNITADRVHKFRFFLGRIGIVEKQIAFSAVFFRRAEINEHALYVPDVQIPVRFGGKTSLNFRHFSAFDILVYDLFDKVRRFR